MRATYDHQVRSRCANAHWSIAHHRTAAPWARRSPPRTVCSPRAHLATAGPERVARGLAQLALWRPLAQQDGLFDLPLHVEVGQDDHRQARRQVPGGLGSVAKGKGVAVGSTPGYCYLRRRRSHLTQDQRGALYTHVLAWAGDRRPPGGVRVIGPPVNCQQVLPPHGHYMCTRCASRWNPARAAAALKSFTALREHKICD